MPANNFFLPERIHVIVRPQELAGGNGNLQCALWLQVTVYQTQKIYIIVDVLDNIE